MIRTLKEGVEWKFRHFLIFSILSISTFLALCAALMLGVVFILKVSGVDLSSEPPPNVRRWLDLLPSSYSLFGGLFIFYLIVMPAVDLWLMARFSRSSTAVVSFFGFPTRYYLRPGLWLLPFLCTPRWFSVLAQPWNPEPTEVITRDGFTAKISVSSGVRFNDPFLVTELSQHSNPNVIGELIQTNLKAIAHEFASLCTVLELTSMREARTAACLARLNDRLGQYGLSSDYLHINTIEIPKDIGEFIEMLSMLKARFPDLPESRLVDAVNVSKGRISKSSFDVSGLEEVMKVVTAMLKR